MTAIAPTPVSVLASHLKAVVEGEGSYVITGVASLDAAGPGDLTFFANPRYAAQLTATRAGVVILDAGAARPASAAVVLRVTKPYLAFARALQFLAKPDRPHFGIHPGAHVDFAARVDGSATVMSGAYVGPHATVGPGTVIYPNATVMSHVKIGRDCLIYPGVVIREECAIGDRVILHNMASIGADGYGFAQDAGVHVKIPQVGNVVIGDDVEIGANTCIDRAAMGSTSIGRGTKIDNLVQIGHGCRIGQDVLIVAQTGISGSTAVEDRAIIGARGGIVGHIVIGAGATVMSRATVTKSVAPGLVISGNPARPHREALRHEAMLGRLAEIPPRVEALEIWVKSQRPKRASRSKAAKKQS